MTRRKPVRLFRYSAPRAASRTLRVLRTAWPDTQFRLVSETLGFGFNILATKPDGSAGRVARANLRAILASSNKES